MVDRGIKDFSIVLATLDGGRLVSDLTQELRELNDTLARHAATQGKAKGELTVKFTVSHVGDKVFVTPAITVKTPKAVREDAVFWLTGEGELTTLNPKASDPRQLTLGEVAAMNDISKKTVKEPPAERAGTKAVSG